MGHFFSMGEDISSTQPDMDQHLGIAVLLAPHRCQAFDSDHLDQTTGWWFQTCFIFHFIKKG
jgi:hypothetical protein